MSSGHGPAGVLRRAWGVAPTTGNGVSAMSLERRAQLLAGHDATTVLEAASTVLADIENGRFSAVAARLPRGDQQTLTAWSQRATREGATVASTPVHPLAVLAATTLALGQSGIGPRSDSIRDDLASRLTTVGLRFNVDVLEGPSRGDDDIAALATRAAVWRAVEQEDWMLWSYDLIDALNTMSEAQDVLARFHATTELTLEQWWLRGVGERATRQVHGARSWGGADVDPRVDRAWQQLAIAPLDEAVAAARAALVPARRRRWLEVADPFDLHWLATRPVVATPDGRRFHLWLGSITRALLPAAIGQTVADATGARYDNVTELLGRAAERLLTAAIEAVPNVDGDVRLPEHAMPPAISKGDYLIEHNDVLFGVDFTLVSPTRDLTRGTTEAVDKLIGRVAGKFSQIYSSFRWRDPTLSKRWLPMVVFASPTAINDPLLNERIHRRLLDDGHAPVGPSELMSCGAPEFLDLLHAARSQNHCLVDLILDWRDGPHRGTLLDWWLADHNALRGSGKTRIGRIADRAAEVLAPTA